MAQKSVGSSIINLVITLEFLKECLLILGRRGRQCIRKLIKITTFGMDCFPEMYKHIIVGAHIVTSSNKIFFPRIKRMDCSMRSEGMREDDFAVVMVPIVVLFSAVEEHS